MYGMAVLPQTTASMESEQESGIFSDDESKSQMIEHVMKKCMLPVMAIFCACVVPQWSMVNRYVSAGTGDLSSNPVPSRIQCLDSVLHKCIGSHGYDWNGLGIRPV